MKLSIISFIGIITAWLLMILAGITKFSFFIGLSFSVILALVSLISLVLGIYSLIKHEKNTVLSIVSIILSLTLLIICLLFILAKVHPSYK